MFIFIVQSQDRHAAGVGDYLAQSLAPIGQSNPVQVDLHDHAVVSVDGFDLFFSVVQLSFPPRVPDAVLRKNVELESV